MLKNSPTAPINYEPRELDLTGRTITSIAAMVLPRRDRSRDMGMHTECMCANDWDTQQLCTKYTANSKLKQCRFIKFEFMCDYVKEMD